MARLVEAQAHAAHALAGRVPAASADHIARCIEEGRPVYPALGWPRDPVWRQALDLILGRLATEEAASLAVRELGAAPPERIEEIAGHLLAGEFASVHPGQAPLVAAALQVYWNALASQLDASLFRPGGQAAGCARPAAARRWRAWCASAAPNRACATCTVRCATPSGT